jgi:putative salt-induced outer membrane protein YdiY
MAALPLAYYERVSRVDFNMTWNDGNTNNRSNLLFADTRIRLGTQRHVAELTIARDETDDVSTKKQDLARYSYNWLFNEPWYVGGTASYERDPIRDLSYRYTLGALVGRDIFKDSRKFLTISVGMGYSEQKLAGETDGGATALWNLVYEHKFRDGNLAFFHNENISYQFYGDNDMIIKTNTGFRYDILANLYTTVAFRWDYETEPAPGTESYDTTLAVGLGARF